MQLKKILKAAFRIRNIALLASVAIIAYVTEYLPFALIGAAGYVYFVMQTLKDRNFIAENLEEDKADDLIKLGKQCDELYMAVRNEVGRPYQESLKHAIQNKNEFLEMSGSGEYDFVKHRVIEQSIHLIMANIQLISQYSQRKRHLDSFDFNAVMDRVNNNERKVMLLQDSEAIEDIRHSIEMDRELLDMVAQKKKELERIGAKLTYIESTIKTFKHQVLSSESTDASISEIENIINEAEALNTVLDDTKQRDRL